MLLMFNCTSKVLAQKRDMTVTDIDGNRYKTVVIGEQEWMAENLKTTKFNDGADIPNVTDMTDWVRIPASAYSWYNNDITNKETYGALYNWYTVNAGYLCPDGWRVPADADWTILTNFLQSGHSFGSICCVNLKPNKANKPNSSCIFSKCL